MYVKYMNKTSGYFKGVILNVHYEYMGFYDLMYIFYILVYDFCVQLVKFEMFRIAKIACLLILNPNIHYQLEKKYRYTCTYLKIYLKIY